jgi:hypothetical protein
MTLPEFRDEMNMYWRSAVVEWNGGKGGASVHERLSVLYCRFDASERKMADQIIAEWLKGHTGGQRYDARLLVKEFKILSALPALEQLACRLAADGSPVALNELDMVRRTLKAFDRT